MIETRSKNMLKRYVSSFEMSGPYSLQLTVILNDQCSDLLFQKEQRNASYSSSAYETLTEEKRKQMKNFIKMFSAKVVKGLVERRKSVRGPGHRMSKLQDLHSDPSSSFCTPTEGNFAISPSGALNQGQAEGIKLSGSENGNTHLQDTVIMAARAL